MATIVDAYSPYVVVPKLPTYKKPYTPKQNTDPSAYYTKALGFLPIDVRYMVNTTNRLAYNSMADVLFNKAAQEKRWANKPWMQGVSNPLRIVADTALLIKDTVVDPIVQGSIEDGWSGFARGGSTALMNTLVNIGNTLDIVSNPVKGLVLDGPEGFIKGLYGDEHGRKQYDYNEYINTGDGVADFLLSLVAEIVSDPLNWVSFGGKQAIASGADVVSTSATKSIKEALEGVLETGTKTVDDLIPTLKSVTGDISDDAAKSFLQNMADESGNIAKTAVSKVDELQPVLKKAITRAEVTGDYSKVANSLAQSKKTRYKASFFDPTAAKLTPASQAFVSSYLENATKNMPDLLGRNVNRRIAAGVAMRNFANKAETVLRYTAGVTGLDWFIGGYKVSNKVAGWVRNELALKDPGVLKTIDEVYNKLDKTKITSAVEELGNEVDSVANSTFINSVLDKHSSFNALLYSSSFNKKSIAQITKAQQQLLEELDGLVKELNITNVNTYSDYIKYLEDSNVLLKSEDIGSLIDQCKLIQKHLSEDFADTAVSSQYKRAVKTLKYAQEKFEPESQGSHMAKLDAELREWNRTHGSEITEALEKHADDVDEAIKVITAEDFVSDLKSKLIPRTLDALTASKQHQDVIDSFTNIWEEFNESLKALDENINDVTARSNVVKSYNALEERIKSFTKFDTTDLTGSNAVQRFNKLGASALENTSRDTRKFLTPEEVKHITDIAAEEANILKQLQHMDNAYTDLYSKEAIDKFINSDWYKSLSKKERLVELNQLLTDRKTFFLNLKNGEHWLKVLNEAEILKNKYPTIYYDGTSYSNYATDYIKIGDKDIAKVADETYTLKELSDAIESLPSFQHVKELTNIISPEDIAKYQLVVYSIMNRRAAFLHLMLGLEQDGKAVMRVLESLDVKPKVLEQTYNNPTVGAFFKYLKENNKLPKNYNTPVFNAIDKKLNTELTKNTVADYFVKDIRNIANDFLRGATGLTTVGNTLYAKQLQVQAKTLLGMSDDEIKSLIKLNTKSNYNQPEAFLNNLLKEYSDTNSDLYKLLNSSEALEDTVHSSTIKEAKELFERLQNYKVLVEDVSKLIDDNGLPNFYTEALLDQVVTQLNKRGRLAAEYINLDNVTKEIMNGVNLFIRNRFNAPSIAMDRVLWQTVDVFSRKRKLPSDVITAWKNIRDRLSSGLAHGAVVDVDNLTDLLTLSKYSDDVRLKGLFDELQTKAKGKCKVVLDIESTDASSNTAHIFQVSGKVLDENGNVIEGSNFNYIIKPPKGVKPTPNVLKIITPDGLDPEDWWNSKIVNAVSDDTQTVFNSLDDVMKEFTTHCNKYGNIILVGHNIKAYDIPALIKHTGVTSNILRNVDVFDTMRFMNNKTVFQLSEETENIIQLQLKHIFETLRAENNVVLKNTPFSGSDVRTLSDLKNLFQERNLGASDLSKSEKASFAKLGLDNIDKSTGTPWGYSIESDDFIETLEYNIRGVIDEWRSPSKIKGNHYYVVSKLNPDVLNDTAKALHEDLIKQGLINVPLGKNIMQYFTGGVGKGNIVINPVKVLSYEAADIFDFNKALDVFKVENKANVMRVQDMAELTKHAKHINNLKWIPSDYVSAVVDDARALLDTMKDNRLVQCLYTNADDTTTVATALYMYHRLATDSDIRLNPQFTHFSDVSKKIADIRGLKDYNPILNKIDEKTGLPRFIFEEDNYFSYDKVVNVIKHDSYFDSVRAYNIDNNLYNAHSAAKHALYEPVVNNAKAVDNYLQSLDSETRKEVTLNLKQYNTALDTASINNIINRANRVEALKTEMFSRGGYVVFETNNTLALDDFTDAGFVVVNNIATGNNQYVHFICATRKMFNTVDDVDLGLKTLKNVDGVDNTLFEYLKEMREYAANNGIKNIGYSHGDLITEDTIILLHEALRRHGISESIINTLVNVDDLLAAGYFSTLRANNSIIGGKSLWQFISDDINVHYISDPFKQIAYSTRSGIVTMREELIMYCNLILNKHSDINTADIYKNLSDKDLYKVLKENPDMCAVYITKTGYWDNTASGMIVKEFDLVNVASITKARQMGAIHIIPRTQAEQVMKAVNKFELPPIAKFAKAISDVYKVAYLGSLGFLVRNFIDSNFKTYASLDGQVSLPKSVSHFFQSLGYVRKHTNIGQEYTKAMGKYFGSDLEYEVFYKYCNSFGDDIKLEDIISSYPEKVQSKVVKQLNELSEKVTEDVIKSIKPNLIDPEFFTVMDSFINHGPSAGLSKTILQEMPNASKSFDELGVLESWNKWVTEKTPARFVYGANDYIEQAARLSMFLQRLELGDNIDDAIKGVIKTHFDYSDKSIGMLYTEILFPFMSFSYKNLNFWIDMMHNNPLLVGQLENIFRTILDYQGLFEPDQGAYEAYDYSFDWSKDVTSFESNMPWTYINAARLYHILNGNIVLDTGKDVKHDAGYGEKNNDLYRVFKLSPSVLDATKMLFTPLNTYSERLLPPGEVLKNVIINMANGKGNSDLMSLTTLANMLPYSDILMQRVGINSVDNGIKLKHNNVFQRTKDVGVDQLLLGSLFGAAYVPQKEHVYYYDSDYNILGGFKTNYYAKRYYTDPYNSKYPSYTLTRMAQNRRPRSIYGTSKTSRIYAQQYNSYQYYKRNTADSIIRNRLKDNYYYY